MQIRVFNTLSRTKEDFVPITPGQVGMYLCGPTVYSYSHMGHLVGPIIFDTIKRYLTFNGLKVTFVVNITDVDDKIIERAKKDNVTWQEVAQRVTADYKNCMQAFGIEVDHHPHATQYINEMQEIIKVLISKGHAYAVGGDVYFDVMSDPDYGKLSNRKLDELLAGVRKEVNDLKKNAGDFALWKGAKPGEPAWDSPWGPGRPGWHIECSAMSHKLLGETFDIHGGGLDLCFPHHEDEIAQSECYTGKPFAKYWLHNGLLRRSDSSAKLGGRSERAAETPDATDQSDIEEQMQRKDSKSKGNVFEIREMLKRYSAETIRFFIIATHYRRPIDFSFERIDETARGLDRFHEFATRFERLTGRNYYELPAPKTRAADAPKSTSSFLNDVQGLRTRFLAFMDDDFNTGGAIGVLFELLPMLNRFADQSNLEGNPQGNPAARDELVAAATVLRELTSILHLLQTPPAVKAEADDGLSGKLMDLIIKIRGEVRKAKQFAVADLIRDGLTELGIVLEDRPAGTSWKRTK